MAKSKKSAVAVAEAEDFFGGAITAPPKGKKSKGTQYVIEDTELGKAATGIVEAEEAKKEATNRGNLYKGQLGDKVLDLYVDDIAKNGLIPETPVTVNARYTGEDGTEVVETLTWVVQDKTQSNVLSPEQVEALENILGKEKLAEYLVTKTLIGFNPATMEQTAENDDTLTVQQVVFSIINKALTDDPRLSVDQKRALFEKKVVTCVKQGTFEKLAELGKKNAQTIKQLIQAIGSGIVRYFKC